VSELPLDDLPSVVAAAARRAAGGEVVYLTAPGGPGRPLAAIVPAEIAMELESLGPAALCELVEDLADAQAARQALADGGELLPDQARALDPDHPSILTTRHNIAYWTAHCGDASGALQLYRELLPDRVRVLGPDHRDVLITRNNIAYWAKRAEG